jgi:hypothetical protein
MCDVGDSFYSKTLQGMWITPLSLYNLTSGKQISILDERCLFLVWFDFSDENILFSLFVIY